MGLATTKSILISNFLPGATQFFFSSHLLSSLLIHTSVALAGEFSMPPSEPIRRGISCGLDLTAGGARAAPSTSSRMSRWEPSLFCQSAFPLMVCPHCCRSHLKRRRLEENCVIVFRTRFCLLVPHKQTNSVNGHCCVEIVAESQKTMYFCKHLPDSIKQVCPSVWLVFPFSSRSPFKINAFTNLNTFCAKGFSVLPFSFTLYPRAPTSMPFIYFYSS